MGDISLYEAVARNMRDVAAKGTGSATGTVVYSSAFIHPVADQLKGKSLYIYDGAGAGQMRTITKSIVGSKSVEIGVQFTTTPSINSGFLVFNKFEAEDYENSMNRAMGWAKLRHLEEKSATLSIVPTQYEYPVPSGYEYISTLRLVPSGGTSYSDYGADDEVQRLFEIPTRFWRIEANPLGTFVISLDPQKIDLNSFDGQAFRVMGQVKPDFTATLISEDMEEYIVSAASMLMCSQRISENQEWRSKFAMFRDTTKDLEQVIWTRPRGKKVG